MSQNNQPNLEPIIPPSLLLGGAVVALIAAFGVAFTQGIGIVPIALVGVAILLLVGWALFAPDQFSAIIQGRAVRFGGLSIVVTIIFLFALIAVYSLLKDIAIKRNLRLDLTQTDTYSLNDASRGAIQAIGGDPNVPSVKIIAFYGTTNADSRDRDSILFDDYVSASNSKITYEFVDPDRNPVITSQYKVTRAGQVVVVANKTDGTPDVDNAQLIEFVTQENLNRAILRAVARGDFRVYVLSVEGGLELERSTNSGLSALNNVLTEQLGWTTQEVSIFQISSNEVNLLDPAANGSVLIIPGGEIALPDESLPAITNYLNAGGDAIILGDISTDPTLQALATADNFTTYLRDTYGVSFNRGIVLDAQQRLQSEFEIVADEFSPAHPITSPLSSINNAIFIFDSAHPIDIAATAPANVTVTTLVSSSGTSYLKSVEAALADDIAQADTDTVGPFPVVVTAENTVTGSRIVLIGSKQTPSNRYLEEFAGTNVANFDLIFNTITWTTRFDDFLTALEPALTRPDLAQDAPIFATSDQVRTISLISVVLLPFGTLAIGIYVWWTRRTPAAQES